MKKALALLLALALVLSVAACGKKITDPLADNTTETSTDSTETQNTENSENTENTENTEHTEETTESTTESTESTESTEDTEDTENTEQTPPPHTHKHNVSITKKATCTADGVKTFTCGCGHSYTEKISATGHSWGSWVTTKEPTVDAEGSAKRTCGNCGLGETKSLPRLAAGDANQITVSQAVLNQIKTEFLRLVNAERTGLGLGALTLNENLDNAASIRSNETLELFSHTRPNGEPYYTVIDPAVYDYTMLGENLCMTTHVGTGSYSPTQDKWVASDAQIEAAAAWTFTLFKNSPGHYENMITPGYKECGIGISYAVEDGIPYFYTAHLFGTR